MTTYLIDPRRPGGPPRTVRVEDDTPQGAAFLEVLRGLYGNRLHPLPAPEPEEVPPCTC